MLNYYFLGEIVTFKAVTIIQTENHMLHFIYLNLLLFTICSSLISQNNVIASSKISLKMQYYTIVDNFYFTLHYFQS